MSRTVAMPWNRLTYLPVPPHLRNLATARTAAAPVPNPPTTTNSSSKNGLSIKVATWNVLAQCLIKRDQYPGAAKSALRSTARRQLLTAWTTALDADIYTLQEVDMVAQLWTPLLRKLGYEYLHCAKSAGFHGLLIGWRAATWRCVRSAGVSLDSDPLVATEELLQKVEDMTVPDSYADKRAVAAAAAGSSGGPVTLFPGTGNVGMMVELEHLESGRRIVVCTAHLYWIPRGAYIRVRQAAVLMNAIAAFNTASLPLVAAGDFNALCGRVEHSLWTGAPLTPLHLHRLSDIPLPADNRTLPDDDAPLPEYEFGSVATPDLSPSDLLALAQRQPRLLSCYDAYPQLDPAHANPEARNDAAWTDRVAEPAWTTYTAEFQGTLDYIFVADPKSTTSDQETRFPWRVDELLALPTPAEMAAQEGGGLPSVEHPSDHVPLVAVLTLLE
ncbi:Endonuclease/exonuclease/phosphatase [Blastocladiella britannica]|nr:Endonuclease/exonuclease/phosphatase [Blastocladiella britannica]